MMDMDHDLSVWLAIMTVGIIPSTAWDLLFELEIHLQVEC